MRHFPDADDFRHAARRAQLIPVYRQLLSDHLTPVAAFEVLGRDDHAFLLESVLCPQDGKRYSFVATSPSIVYLVFAGRAAILRNHQRPEESETLDPIADLQALLPKRSCHQDLSLPAFTGGLVGYAGYDTARYYHQTALSEPPVDDRRLPDLLFGLYGDMVIFDHAARTIKVLTNCDVEAFRRTTPSEDDAVEAAYREACRRVDEIVRRLQQPTVTRLGEIILEPSPDRGASNVSREQFDDIARMALHHIHAGTISQLAPSLRLRLASEIQPFEVYRVLRVMNPSASTYYMKSPVCVSMGLGTISHATSLTSLREVIPSEAVTGIPKLPAMQILDQLEPTRRGPYGGALGYIDHGGNAHVHVSDRMILWHNGSFDAQAATTVVVDSLVEQAYDRALAEAELLLRAVGIAERSF